MPDLVCRPNPSTRVGLAFSQSFRLLLIVQLFLLAPLSVPAHADTNGPGTPWTGPWNFANNACGPCTDTNTWSPGPGPNIGNGVCGRCSNKNWKRSSGSCQGTDPGAFNCKAGKCKSTATDTFTSPPVGGFTYAGCIAAAIVGGIAAEIGVLAACAAACTVAGVFTLGASCVACIAANVTAASIAACALSDCIENCNFIGPRVYAGPIVSCCR